MSKFELKYKLDNTFKHSMEFHEECLPEVCEYITQFLAACGYVMDGKEVAVIDSKEKQKIVLDDAYPDVGKNKLPFGWDQIQQQLELDL